MKKDWDLVTQLEYQLEGLALGLEQSGQKSAAHCCRMAFKEMQESRALISRIKDALGTAEDGEALVEVARNAHRAEQKLAYEHSLETLGERGGRGAPNWDDVP